MRYLLLSSIIFWGFGCKTALKGLHPVQSSSKCVQQFIPLFENELYRTSVDVVGKHLSGLLLIKKMPDSSIRMVFANEMGLKFFDFEFKGENRFLIHQIMPQLNKRAITLTLQKDFEMLLMRQLKTKNIKVMNLGDQMYYGVEHQAETDYYITNLACTELVSIQRATRRAIKVEMKLFEIEHGIPDSVFISHFGFPFTISLQKLQR